MFIDLDGFKAVNDQYGHPVGSDVLKQVAVVIRAAVREVDIPIRYGGDEFVVVLVGASAAKGLLAAERLRRRIAASPFRVAGQSDISLTASIGLSAFPDHARDRESLIKVADDTMYSSKKRGKNRVTILTREGIVR
jgi:diguanylate cyclase (GGDEF)-like protein